MSNEMALIGKKVIVYDRYLFAVPVEGIITNISEKDGAYAVTFSDNNPGARNVQKHNGKFFHHQQCRVKGTDPTACTTFPDSNKRVNKGHDIAVVIRWFDGYLEEFKCDEVWFGSDILWMRLSGGKNRHIPLRSVRWFLQIPESHSTK